jgi:hypothetical protein
MPLLRQLICSKRQSEMLLSRIQEGPLGYDLRVFQCLHCSHELKTAVKLGDPMQSKRTLEWLQGQLVAPR